MRKITPYSTQFIDRKDITAVVKVLNSKFLTQGPTVGKFEKAIAKKVNAKYSVAFNSATSALHASCLALALKKNEIVWTVPNTFVASANCALLAGGKVDFVDINPTTKNMDLEALEKKLIKAKKQKKLPKIIIPVHFAGNPYPQDKIKALSKKYNFKVIEDASHAIGAKYKKEKVGSCKWSDITVFSFHPVKIITTIEGGIATTNSLQLYNNLKLFGNHGITKDKKKFKIKNQGDWYYEQQVLGLNYRMSDVSAALGLSQLKKLDSFIKERNYIADYYLKKLNQKFIGLPRKNKLSLCTFHLFVIKVKDYKTRNTLFDLLRKNNFLVNLHYLPVHLQPYFRKKGFKSGMFKESEDHSKKSISLPIYPGLKLERVKKTINLINKFFKDR